MRTLFARIFLVFSVLVSAPASSESVRDTLFRVQSLYGKVELSSREVLLAAVNFYPDGISYYSFSSSNGGLCTGDLSFRSEANGRVDFDTSIEYSADAQCSNSGTLTLVRSGDSESTFILKFSSNEAMSNGTSLSALGLVTYTDESHPYDPEMSTYSSIDYWAYGMSYNEVLAVVESDPVPPLNQGAAATVDSAEAEQSNAREEVAAVVSSISGVGGYEGNLLPQNGYGNGFEISASIDFLDRSGSIATEPLVHFFDELNLPCTMRMVNLTLEGDGADLGSALQYDLDVVKEGFRCTDQTRVMVSPETKDSVRLIVLSGQTEIYKGILTAISPTLWSARVAFRQSGADCSESIWNSELPNLADWFRCDEQRALTYFSETTILKTVFYDAAVKDGSAFVEARYLSGAILAEEKYRTVGGQSTSAVEYFDLSAHDRSRVGESSIDVACWFPVAQLGKYTPGKPLTFNTVIRDYRKGRLVLDCSLS